MKTLNFEITINAAVNKVWDTMIGSETYKRWTADFCEGSYFEGSWNAGEKIRFLSPDGGGMTSIIAENKPHQSISIKHLGYVKNGIDDTESAEIKAWAPAFENYTFDTREGTTKLKVDVDVAPEYEDYMQSTFPKALARLKSICE
jgi:hypothetical protein